MDTLSRIPGVSQLRQQLSGARYSTLPRDGADGQDGRGDVIFQSEDADADAERGEPVPLASRSQHGRTESGEDDAELGEEVSDEHAAFVHEHASYRPRRRHRPGGMPVNVKASTLIKVLAALGVLWALWVGMKIGWAWFMAPKKGVEEVIPVFGEQLGCAAAPYYYTNPSIPHTRTNHTQFTLPLSTPSGDGDNSFLLRTQGANTYLTLTIEFQPDTTITDLIAEVSFASPEEAMDFRLSGVGPTFDAAPHMFYEALEGVDYCIRMDTILRIPGNLHSLNLDLQTVSHIRIGNSWGNGQDAFSPFLKNLEITLHADSPDNLLIPSPAFSAEEVKLSLAAGHLSGDLAIARSLDIAATPRGIVDLSALVLSPQQGMGVTPASLETHSGSSPFHMRVKKQKSEKTTGHGLHRCLRSLHQSSEGDVRLEYEAFEGHASWTAGKGSVVEGVGEGGRVGGGEEEGCDELRVNCEGRLDLTMS